MIRLGSSQVIPEPFRSRLIAAVGNPVEIDAIHREAMKAHPGLFQPFKCLDCIRPNETHEGDLQCRGKTMRRDSERYCMDFKSRRAS